MNGHSITIGTLFGIQLRLHYSWLIVFALVAWSVIFGYLPIYYPWLELGTRIIAGLVITFLFFASVICHEYAHSLVAKRRGLTIKRITLFLFGGAAELQEEPKSAKTELLMTAAGPATSLLIAVVSGVVWAVGQLSNTNALIIIAEPLTVLNLVVGLFNLLPGYPLDGGRILRAILWSRKKDIVQATKAATNVSYVIAYLMIAYGMFEIFIGNIVGGLWLSLISFFLLQAAQISLLQTTSQKQLESMKVRDVMSEHFTTVPALTPIEVFVRDYVLRHEQYDFLVMGKDEVVGIIEFSRISRVRDVVWDEPVSRYMRPLPKNLQLKPDDLANKALQLMQRHNVHILPVYERAALVGVITIRRINDYLFIHRARNGAINGRFVTSDENT